MDKILKNLVRREMRKKNLFRQGQWPFNNFPDPVNPFVQIFIKSINYFKVKGHLFDRYAQI
jgi:hypothetical protein